MMSELKRATTPVANSMTVIDKGDDILRPGSTASISRKPLKKATSEGLISLSPEPGNVKFETPLRPSSGGSRCGSAGRVEKKLQVLKKKDEGQVDPIMDTSSAEYKVSRTSQPDNSSVSSKPKPVLEEKRKTKLELDSESSDDSETDSDISDSDEKPMAPIEMKGEFLKYVMDEDYTKAKELCQKILLLEPDNSVCIEFHGVIVQKMEQEKEAEENDSDDSDDDSDEDSDEEEEEGDEENEDDSSSSEEESESDDDDFTPPPGLNLLMGGLPIKPQPKNK